VTYFLYHWLASCKLTVPLNSGSVSVSHRQWQCLSLRCDSAVCPRTVLIEHGCGAALHCNQRSRHPPPCERVSSYTLYFRRCLRQRRVNFIVRSLYANRVGRDVLTFVHRRWPLSTIQATTASRFIDFRLPWLQRQ